MAVIDYQNPGTISLVLDSANLGGAPEVHREIMVIGDSVTSANLTSVSSSGALKVDPSGGTAVESTAAWTSATALNTALTVTVSGFSVVTVVLNQGSTITGGAVTFEVSDTTAFTNAYPVHGVTVDGFTEEKTYTLIASTNQAFTFNVSGFAAFRVRLSTVIAGTATINVGIISQALANAPVSLVGGTVTTNAGTNLNTSALQLDTTGSKLNNAQGSATAGQSGPLIQGAVTTTAPAYTTAQTSPLSLTTAGALRTDASATTQPVSGTVTITGTATSNQGTANTTANAWPVKVTDGTNTAAIKAASTAAAATDPSAVVALSPNSPLPAGTNSLGSITNTGFNVNNAPNVSLIPITTGGLSDYHVVAAASANAANIKASAGQVYGWNIFNNAGYPVYVKFHNTAVVPTAGTGVIHTIGVQAGTRTELSIDNGFSFATGIGITIVKGIADADATAVAASDCVVDVYFK